MVTAPEGPTIRACVVNRLSFAASEYNYPGYRLWLFQTRNTLWMKRGNAWEFFSTWKNIVIFLRNWRSWNPFRAFDAAKASQEEAVPFDQAVREIEQQRR